MLNTIALLIPVFLAVAFFEWYICYRQGKDLFTGGSTTMNMALGAIDQIVSLLDFILLYAVLEFCYRHFRLFEFENNWLQWIAAYVAVDFVSYWYHRFSHEVNILWAGHITHHSGDHFNFTNGFRGSPLQGFNRILFWTVLPVAGFSPLVLVLTLKFSAIYDFILHTQNIPKLGFLEKILITPSMHRVHHGKNEMYIDKNYGSTFVIWDKMFGTFQEETEPVVYGIKNAAYKDVSPLKAITFHYEYLWNMMKHTRGIKNKIRLWFMPPDWIPEDVPAEDLIAGFTQKNEPQIPLTGQYRHYAWFQIACCSAGVIALLATKDFLTVYEFVVLAALCILGLVNAALIFNNNLSPGYRGREGMRLALLAVTVLALSVWFGNMLLLPGLVYLVGCMYFVTMLPAEKQGVLEW